MKKCMNCGKCAVSNSTHDLCYACWSAKELKDIFSCEEEVFEDNLDCNKIHSVYIMSYGRANYKIGYTNDISSRILEIKKTYPANKLLYFREFVTESEARRFESWLKTLTMRKLHKIISTFQDKLRKISII
jgi:predicted GIY-YIG superfamily endonuclease